MSQNSIAKEKFQKINKDTDSMEKIVRPSLTYWQDAWRRLKKNVLAMAGLICIILLVIAAVFGPMMATGSFSDQNLSLANIPPSLEIVKVDDTNFVFLQKEYRLYHVSEKGDIIAALPETKNDVIKSIKEYEVNGKVITVDYSFAKKAKSDTTITKKYELRIDGELASEAKKVSNKTYIWGSDSLGRDLYVRVLNGARISLLIALVATVVNFFIGVLYGGISGYVGGQLDNIMMRGVDIVSSIPMMLYVILLMVVIGPGLKTIIIVMGLVFWLGMARIVRGQALSLKEQEFILAAKTVGASTWRILVRHLIPNAMGPIIVALTMMIPNAIFTEAFLSFVGLGVPAPLASWGTLANDALGGLRSFPYLLFYPSLAICITMLAFNFLGDGLRDALDPRLRK
jgi:oligopeptide transport system permease protein